MPRGPNGERPKIATGEIEDPIRYTERRVEGREGPRQDVDARAPL